MTEQAADGPGPIPLCVPVIGETERAYVDDCLVSGWVSSAGPYVDRFEREFAAYVQQPAAVATASGTAALHIALLVAGVRPGDLVLAPTLTFVASTNAIAYTGAVPVLFDVEATHWQLDPALVERFLREECDRTPEGPRHRETGRRVGALLPVDLLGHPCDYARLRPLAAEHGIPMVEDATESLGAWDGERPIGASADIACFSFNGNKMITTGGGGMIVTAREDWAQRARHLSTQARADAVEYTHDEVGYNYRLTNVQAALGCAQLERIAEFTSAKQRIARRYDRAFAAVTGVSVLPTAPGVRSAHWLYTVRIEEARFGCSARELMQRLAAQGIQSRPLFRPVHQMSLYPDALVRGGGVAERLWAEGLSLPCSADLSEADQERVIDGVLRGAR